MIPAVPSGESSPHRPKSFRPAWRRLVLALLLAAGLLTTALRADDFVTLTTYNPQTNVNIFGGIQFRVTSPQLVGQLGIIDGNNDGVLSQNSAVGIYSVPTSGSTLAGTHIVSAVVPAGTAGTSIGVRQAFFVNVTPVVLQPGDYVIAAEAGGSPREPFSASSGSATFISGTQYINGWFVGSFPGLGSNATFTNQSGAVQLSWLAGTFRTLTGIALEQPAGTNVYDGSGSVDFGGGTLGVSVDRVFRIRNTGPTNLTGLSITFDGAGAGDYTVFAAPTEPVAPGATTDFTIRFTPSTAGPRPAFLRLASSAPAPLNPYDVQLLGFGTSGAPISGTKSVGPTGNYLIISHALRDLQLNGINGALLLELQAAYAGSSETYPLAFSNLGTDATKPLTIRPAVGATGLSITSTLSGGATAAIDLDGAQYVTIDGRPGGVGTNKELTIAHTFNSGIAVRFLNEASRNALRYLTVRGVNDVNASGVIYFGGTTGANGNDDNVIDSCDIRDGATTPKHLIYSLGTNTSAAQFNSGNTVSNCNLFNFYTSTVNDSTGIRLEDGNTAWTIAGNSFYQTASRSATAANRPVRAIYLNGTNGSGYTVTGNFIGGSQPLAAGTPWTTTGTAAAYQFVGIHLNVGTATPSSVQGNTIQNIVWTSNSMAATVPGVWTGIYVAAGSANIGTVTGNTIGSGTGTGSIRVTTGNNGTTFGIGSASSAGVNIANNTVGSITVQGTSAAVGNSLVGIQVTAGTNTISGNLIGSTGTAGSLAGGASTATVTQLVTGIVSSSGGGATISGNTIANLQSSYTGTSAGQTRGVVTTGGANSIVGNTVRNLTTTSRNVQIQNASVALIGISQTSTVAGQTVSQNTVHSLSNTSTTAGGVCGIYHAGPTAGTNLIARNLIHSLSLASTNASSILDGLLVGSGVFTVQNNMIRVGLDASGVNTAGVSLVRGITDLSASSTPRVYHNSVYVAGTQTSGANNTLAFQSVGDTNTRDFRHNIFFNARTGGGGTGKHYAVVYGGTTANPTGLTAERNLFYVNGLNGVLGLYNNIDRPDLSAWQSATGLDLASLYAPPLFVAPNAPASTIDLHLQSGSAGRMAGEPLPAVTDDFDGDPRSATAPDLGADESPGIPPAFLSAAGTTFTIGSGGSFTVAASGVPEPTFSVSGALPLGVNFNGASGLLAGTPASGTAGSYSLVFTASNGVAPNATQNFTLFINTPPVVGPLALGTSKGVAVTAPASRLVLAATDADGDPLSLASVAPTSAQGGTVVLASGNVTYTPAANFTGTDSFGFAISDGRGGLASGTVTVTVTAPPSGNGAGVTVGMNASGQPVLKANGIPRRVYTVEVSDNLSGSWMVLTTVTASNTGVISFTDTTTPRPSSRFYRLR